MSRFLEESIRNKSAGNAYATTEFLKEQMEQAQKELDEIEGKLQAFQTENNGRLPDQLDSNVRQLQALQTQVGNIGGQISRANRTGCRSNRRSRFSRTARSAIAKEQPIEQQTREYQQKNLKLTEAERDVRMWKRS